LKTKGVMTRIKKISLVTFFIWISISNVFAQVNQYCSGMLPICLNTGLEYTTSSGLTSESGNDYGCLWANPNPAWFYLEIENPGDITMELNGQNDIDYIIYGPFDSLDAALFYCGSMGVDPNAPIADCSMSSSSTEFPEITGALSGQVYVLLITNYAMTIQPVQLYPVGGDATTVCEPVICDVSVGTHILKKNGLPAVSPMTLYLNQQLKILSYNDFILPNDTIAQPQGDGIYSATMLWLIYDHVPIMENPALDPGFTGEIIVGKDLIDFNNSTSPIIQNWGCGDTYWFVPITADDGIGGNNNVDDGITDNGLLHWDRDGDDCFDIGNAVEVTYSCQPDIAGIQSPELVMMFFSNGILNVQNLQTSATLIIYDLSGKKITSMSVENGSNSISNLPSGNYIFELNVNEAQADLIRERVVVLN
jgi:hypothetical protein